MAYTGQRGSRLDSRLSVSHQGRSKPRKGIIVFTIVIIIISSSIYRIIVAADPPSCRQWCRYHLLLNVFDVLYLIGYYLEMVIGWKFSVILYKLTVKTVMYMHL